MTRRYLFTVATLLASFQLFAGSIPKANPDQSSIASSPTNAP